MAAKLNIGDRVEIVRYGSLLWESKAHRKLLLDIGMTLKVKPDNIIEEYSDSYSYDIHPHLIGQVGIVDKVEETQGRYMYALNGITKRAWYDETQLKKVN